MVVWPWKRQTERTNREKPGTRVSQTDAACVSSGSSSVDIIWRALRLNDSRSGFGESPPSLSVTGTRLSYFPFPISDIVCHAEMLPGVLMLLAMEASRLSDDVVRQYCAAVDSKM